MAEYKTLTMKDAMVEGAPNWAKVYGKEFIWSRYLLDHAYYTAPGEFDNPEEDLANRNKYLDVLKDELIPIFNRFRKSFPEEFEEIQAVASKYEDEETGLFAVMARDLEAFLESGPTRHPDLWPTLTEMMKEPHCTAEIRSIRRWRGSKTVFPLEKGQPQIAINYGNRISTEDLIIKGYQTMCSRLDKASALQQDQTQLLKNLLAENGLQLPPEFATIQQQLDDLKRPRTEEELAQESMDKGEDPCPDAKALELFEGVEGSGQFFGIYQNKAKKFTMPPPPPPRFDFHLCSKLLTYLKKGDFIKPFMQRPTEKEAPGYSNAVTRHRDVPMISSCLSHVYQKGTILTKYEERAFFGDLRLMIENYRDFFDEGSYQHDCALRLETATYKRLSESGAPGETGKKLFDEPVLLSLEFKDPEPDEPEPEEDADVTLHTIHDEDTPVARILAGENLTPYGTSSPSLRKDKTLNILEKAWKVRHEALQHGKSVAEPEENADVTLHTIHDEDTPVARILEYKDTPHGQSSPSSGRDNTPNTLDKAWKLMDEARQYDKTVGNPTQAPVRHKTQQPGGSSSAQPPRPRYDDGDTGEHPAEDISFFDQYDYPDPDATGFAAPPEAAIDELGADDTFDSLQLSSDNLDAPSEAAADEASPDNTLGSIPNPYSDDLPASPRASAGEADEEEAHASAHASYEPATIAPMVAEPTTIDLTSSPQAQTTHTSSASNKRARESDDQEDSDESDDDAPLVKKRKILAVKASASAAAKGKAPAPASTKGKALASAPASSSRKRRRDDSDGDSDDDADGDYVPEQPSKRQRKTPSKDNAPAAAAAKGKAPAAPSQRETSTAAPKDKGKAVAAPVASTSRKRSRDDEDEEEDDGDNYAPEQSSKRQKPSPALAQAPISAAPAAPGASEDYPPEDYQRPSGRINAIIEAQRLQQLQEQDRWAGLPPSPVPEPFTPERGVTPERADTDGHRSMSPQRAEPAVAGPSRQAAADEPQREPATTSLGLTDQGTITTMQLHKLPKYRRTTHSKGAIANRPWVFRHGTGDQYALYVMRCPSRGCPRANYNVGPDEFRRNPLYDVEPLNHLEECCGDYGGSDNDVMVRKYCKQVISDDKKAVSIEWARKWNNDLIDEYGNYPDADGGKNDMRSHNTFSPPPE